MEDWQEDNSVFVLAAFRERIHLGIRSMHNIWYLYWIFIESNISYNTDTQNIK